MILGRDPLHLTERVAAAAYGEAVAARKPVLQYRAVSPEHCIPAFDHEPPPDFDDLLAHFRVGDPAKPSCMQGNRKRAFRSYNHGSGVARARWPSRSSKP